MLAPTLIAARPHAIGTALGAVRHRVAALSRCAVAWIRARTPEQLLWVVLGLILLAYLVVLWTGSTATGRGGR